MSVVPEPPITLLASHDGGHLQSVVNRVVVHDEEYAVSDDSAESIASYFHQPSTLYQAHYVVDRDSGPLGPKPPQHVVPEHRTAAHAPPNQGSIGIEMDGYARFTPTEWETPGSVGSMQQSATLAGQICDRWGIPKVWLSVADLLAGKRGITSHANVSAAFHQSTHTDPGPSFPVAQYMGYVLGTNTHEEEEPMDVTQAVRNLYLTHLGREPDPGGMHGWTQDYWNRVNNIHQTDAVAMAAIESFFFTCPEGVTFHTDYPYGRAETKFWQDWPGGVRYADHTT